MSAVTSGKKDVEQVIEHAHKVNLGLRTILFVDEIHRFNKAPARCVLPHVDGLITLIGAIENPSFEVITPLLSRSRVLVLQQLTTDEKLYWYIKKRALKVLKKVQASFAQSPGLFVDYRMAMQGWRWAI